MCYLIYLLLCATIVTTDPINEDASVHEKSYIGPSEPQLPPCRDCRCDSQHVQNTRRSIYVLDSSTAFVITDVMGCSSYLPASCGERNEEPRVVGGSGSNMNAFPWIARLIYHKAFGCGASVINDRYVVTAAHCLKGFMWFMFRVTFGEHDRCDHRLRPETRYVMKVIAHNFTLTDLTNDVALLLLSSPLIYSHIIRPVCLPKMSDPEDLYTGVVTTVAGWGAMNETGNWSCTLLEAQLPVLSNEECQNTNYNKSKIRDVMMCAGYPATAHKDACTGDSGGPLVTENKEHAYELIGIVSWGYGCARKGYPGVYARVTRYLQWIKDNTDDACYCDY